MADNAKIKTSPQTTKKTQQDNIVFEKKTEFLN